MVEYWCEIGGLSGYEVSNLGNVRYVKVRPKRVLDGGVVRIHTDGRIVKRSVKKLVRTYHGPSIRED
jgi:hypothetical protein